LSAYDTIRPEVKYHTNSRIDFLLTQDGLPDCYVEVKNVHLKRTDGLAEFPDCVTERGAKHLDALGDVVEQGHRAVMLYCVQRMDCTSLGIAADLDPVYAQAFVRAQQRGVEALAYTCKLTPQGIHIAQAIPII
jgi:sugar fermentation stimulation protein A